MNVRDAKDGTQVLQQLGITQRQCLCVRYRHFSRNWAKGRKNLHPCGKILTQDNLSCRGTMTNTRAGGKGSEIMPRFGVLIPKNDNVGFQTN
jgi:hypothetical protein